MQMLIVALVLTFALSSSAETLAASNVTAPNLPSSSSAVDADEKGLMSTIRERFGMGYFLFWDGPSMEGGPMTNWHGRKVWNGLSFWNQVSFRYKVTDGLAVDLQTRTQWLHTHKQEFRIQAPRLGVSGVLLSGQDWKLVGALNSEIPGIGYVATQRSQIVNPGMFAKFVYTPTGSRWSLFALVTPRFFIYGDRNAAEPEMALQGLRPGQKPEAILSLTPTVNYTVSSQFGLRGGAMLDFRKVIEESWGEWNRWATPVYTGFTYKANEHFEIFPYLQTYPFDGLGLSTANTSVGMWISGTIL